MNIISISLILIYITGAVNRFIDVDSSVRTTIGSLSGAIKEGPLFTAALFCSIFWFAFDWFFIANYFYLRVKK